MKNIRRVLPPGIFWFWLLIPGPAVLADLANAELRGLRAYTVEGVLRLEEDQIDLGTAALIISRNWGTTKTLHTYRRKIDLIAEEIQKRLQQKKIPTDYRAIPEINQYLFNELHFKSIQTADNPEDLFLHVVLDQKRGYCLSLSVLYLAIGERLGLPLYGVVVPGHFFVRYDDGIRRYNIETTAQGGIAEDDHYIQTFAPPAGHKLYMKNLNKRQTLGCFFNNLGNSYSSVGQVDQAFVELSRAVQINPSLAEARTNLGNIYLRKGQPQQAIYEYQEALRILPRDPKTLNNLGNAYMHMNQFQQAQAFYLKALDLDPAFADAHRNLSQAYFRQGQTDKAMIQIRAALALAPEDGENYLQQGRLFLEMQNLPAAQESFQKALLYNPSLTAARIELGNTYMELQQVEWAIEAYAAAARVNDSMAIHAWFGLARAYHEEKRYPEEIRAYQQVLELDPDNVGALQNLGNALLEVGQGEQAVQAYQKAIRINPHSGLYYNLAVAFIRQKQYKEAVGAYQSAIQLDPNYAAAHHGLAVCYYYLNDKKASLKHAKLAKSLGWDVEEELLK
jgi:tetratricopeptide (TPR) repeat protein